ncbi:MAG: YicC family protein [Magnetococcales bacterium]|nr:YicC family protein [Magnetococcales bacterium]
MPRSMTGYARREAMAGEWRIAWRVKSVNHRFLDPLVRLPEGCASLELPAIRLLKERLERGHVECVLTVQMDGDGPHRLDLDAALVDALLHLERRLARRKGGKGRGRLSMDRLLGWPGVARERRLGATLEEGPGREAALTLLDETVAELIHVRAVEGQELAGVMGRLLETLQERVGEVRRQAPRVREALESRLRERVEKFAGALDGGERLAQEVTFLVNRQEIVEEIDRMLVHMREMRLVLSGTDAAGRRLDFLCQELAREANTLCSKAQDAQISRLGVEAKVLVEQLREQAQNLE